MQQGFRERRERKKMGWRGGWTILERTDHVKGVAEQNLILEGCSPPLSLIIFVPKGHKLIPVPYIWFLDKFNRGPVSFGFV